MKNYSKYSILYIIILIFVSCQDMDLNPLSEASSGNWYSDESELDISLNYLFRTQWWNTVYFPYNSGLPMWKGYADDDFLARGNLKVVNDGGMNGQTSAVVLTWNNAYRVIASANTLIENVEADEKIQESKRNFYLANARFVRAGQYSELIFRFGDVPFYNKTLSIDDAFSMGRTEKQKILDNIYDDFDFAISHLPESYSSSDVAYATKGAALAMKARIALYMNDFATCLEATEACINLGVYSLHPNYLDLFLNSTKSSSEFIFITARSKELGERFNIRETLPRLVGGYANGGPSWDLLASYLCTDGLPIDESPLFNPRNPFENRDPRCTATIVEFGTPWLNYNYEPHHDSLKTWDFANGVYVNNQENRVVQLYSSFNGLMLKKMVDESWLDMESDNVNIVMRFADVLLMYAEAKIELNDIDQSVLDAMNLVRARAYGVDINELDKYPSITTSSQAELRKILRFERRMEFAWEGWRYNDLIRWRLAEKALTTPLYGFLDPDEVKEKIINEGLWFWPSTPSIDEDGIPNFDELYNNGYIKILAFRSFEPSRNYLWPIPTTEIEINQNINQNPGY